MLPKVASLNDYEIWSQQNLSVQTYEHMAGYAADGHTKKQNDQDFNLIKLKQRGMANMKYFKGTETTILGHKINSPVALAPWGFQQVLRFEGELAQAKAAQEYGTVFVHSCLSSKSVEEIATASQGGIKFFELATYLKPEVRESLLNRVKQLPDFKAIVINCNPVRNDDYKFLQNENDIKNDFKIVPSVYNKVIQNLVPDNSQYIQSDFKHLVTDQAFKFEQINDIKKVSSLPVVIKGILCKEDALLALKHGADAIWVSNNGGLNLDTAPSTISILKSIVKAVRSDKSVKPTAEVYIDGGIVRGIDILKCLAFGAQGVFLGRPASWSLQYGGADSVKNMLDIMTEELIIGMVLTCCYAVKDITYDQVIHKIQAKL